MISDFSWEWSAERQESQFPSQGLKCVHFILARHAVLHGIGHSCFAESQGVRDYRRASAYFTPTGASPVATMGLAPPSPSAFPFQDRLLCPTSCFQRRKTWGKGMFGCKSGVHRVISSWSQGLTSVYLVFASRIKYLVWLCELTVILEMNISFSPNVLSKSPWHLPSEVLGALGRLCPATGVMPAPIATETTRGSERRAFTPLHTPAQDWSSQDPSGTHIL